jgi:hypothetical protein
LQKYYRNTLGNIHFNDVEVLVTVEVILLVLYFITYLYVGLVFIINITHPCDVNKQATVDINPTVTV